MSLASEREPLLEPNFFFHFGTTKKIRSAYGLELTVLIFLTLYSIVVVGRGIVKLFPHVMSFSSYLSHGVLQRAQLRWSSFHWRESVLVG